MKLKSLTIRSALIPDQSSTAHTKGKHHSSSCIIPRNLAVALEFFE